MALAVKAVGVERLLQWTRQVVVAAVAVCAGCSVNPDLTGRPCPCAAGYVCQTDRCVRASGNQIGPFEPGNGNGSSPDSAVADAGSISMPPADGGAATGLVAWYRFDEADATAGVLDSSGNEFHGTCETTCPAPTEGVVGSALSFDGRGDTIVVPYDDRFATTSAFTLALWALWRSIDRDNLRMMIGKPYSEDSLNSWEIYFRDWERDGTVELHFAQADRSPRDRVSVPLSFGANEWVHIAGTWDGTTAALWVNGERVGTRVDEEVRFDQRPIFLGSDNNGSRSTSFFNGDLDDVRIYDRALDEAEIDALASRGETTEER